MRTRLFRPPVVIPMSDLETTKSDFVITRRRFKKSRRRFLFFKKKSGWRCYIFRTFAFND